MHLDVAGFALLAALLTLAPGQDTVLVLRNASLAGARAGVSTTAGICSGLFLHATLSALGVSALLAASPAAFGALRFAGAAYLVALGLGSLRRARRGGAAPPEPRTAPERRHAFVQGFLSNALNANTSVFYLTLLPQFAVFPATVLRDSLLLAGIHFAMSFGWLAALSLGAGRARRIFARESVRSALHALAGLALIGFGLRLALGRR